MLKYFPLHPAKVSIFCFLCMVLVSCSARRSEPLIISDVSSEKHAAFNKSAGLGEVLILPVFKRVSGVPGKPSSSKQLALPDNELSELLVRAFGIYTSLYVVNSEHTDSESFTLEYDIDIPSEGISQESLFKLAKETQDKTSYKSILFCIVDMSDERTGSRIGSERSSSLTYRIWLFDGKQQAVTWSSAYRSKDGTLSDNLFSIGSKAREGFKFKTNHDLISASFRGSAIKLEQELKKLNSN